MFCAADEDGDVGAHLAPLGQDPVAHAGVDRRQEVERLGDGRRRCRQRDPAAAVGKRLQGARDQDVDRHQAAFLMRCRRGRAARLFVFSGTRAALTHTIGGSPSRRSSQLFPSSRDAKSLPLRVPK